MKNFKKILSVALTGVILFLASGITVISKTKAESVYLGGEPFGVRFYNNGAVIINLESYFNGFGYTCPAKEGGLKVNDIIKEANGEPVLTNEDLQEITQKSKNNEIILTVERNGELLKKKVVPSKSMNGMYLIGAWIRDSCAGIGTITYYDDENRYFAALGHGICDADTSLLLPLGSGEAVYAEINGICKSSAGKIGSLNGFFTDRTIGTLNKNSEAGIYGTINDNFLQKTEKIEIADNYELKAGKAKLFTTVSGNKPQYYSIEITKINNLNKESNENFVIRVTDERILKNCGGIVQGMSGSPIVQNGKLVGAVTHVFINNPKEGYGVTVQNMVANYDE